MKKMPTQLLEYLVKQCTREVLDQLISERANGKPEINAAKASGKKIPIQTKTDKNSKFFVPVKVKKVNEAEKDSPEPEQGSSDKPELSKSESPEQNHQEPSVQSSTPSGPVIINPTDKSRLEPIRFQGHDDASVERTLHLIAAKIAGPKVKISLSAKRLARAAAQNPSASVFFYLGKLDPESEEIFLMAD